MEGEEGPTPANRPPRSSPLSFFATRRGAMRVYRMRRHFSLPRENKKGRYSGRGRVRSMDTYGSSVRSLGDGKGGSRPPLACPVVQ